MTTNDDFVTLSKITGMSGNLLIPVDFSPRAEIALRVGFFFARTSGLRPVVLYVQESAPGEDGDLSEDTLRRFKDFKENIDSAQKAGRLPDVKYSTLLQDGLAEEVIADYCRRYEPSLIVMATRDKTRKDSDLVGSVTAEVVDSVRVPLFTIPESASSIPPSAVRHIVMFCTMSPHDAASLHKLLEMTRFPSVEFFLLPVPDLVSDTSSDALISLRNYLSRTYPNATFRLPDFNTDNINDSLNSLVTNNNIGLLIVPNKKTSVFSRIFKPSIGHRFLFQQDLPMLLLPV